MKERYLCVEKVMAFPSIIVVGVVMLASWVVIGHLVKRIKADGRDDHESVARSVGRRFSSVFNLPTGYDFKDCNYLTTIPEEMGDTLQWADENQLR